ncbi:MAG: NPXTG-anchored protein [Oscillospiraceae bacterium]|nr:NPXTG-anchored protein [Oscillospiraceae bacterium]
MNLKKILVGTIAASIAAISLAAVASAYDVDLAGETYDGFTNLGFVTLEGDGVSAVRSITINGYKFTDASLNIGKILTSAANDNGIANIWNLGELDIKDATIKDTTGAASLHATGDGIMFYVGDEATAITSLSYEVDSTVDTPYTLQFVGWTEASFNVTKNVDSIAAPAEGGASEGGDKGSPSTGVEGVAVVAGLAIIAAGAVVVAKKRG